MPTTSSTSISLSDAYYLTDLVYPTNDSIVTGGTHDSVYLYSSGWVTGYYAVSESIAVPDLDLPVTEIISVAS